MCLDEDQIVLLLEGRLPEGERAEVEAHLDGCAACRRVVGAAAPTGDGRWSERYPERLGRGRSIGRYLVLSLLGQGGMGKVYAAYDPELDRRVALKLLNTAAGSEDARRRLVREARALGKLSHPNVVQVHDVGEHDGDVFVAMELVEGRSLDAWCHGSPRPGWQEVLAAYLDAARGLSAAHEKGLVHRDVKPTNILRGDDGRVRVVDFGLAAGGRHDEGPISAASAEPISAQLTAPGALLGTPLYMAPEQHEGARGTPASDQFSLCTALHEGLHGEPPFSHPPGAGMLAGLLAAKIAGAAPPPAGTPVPAWVQRALARGLAPRPEDRYPSIDALIAALRQDPDARARAWRRAALVGLTAGVLLAAGAVGLARRGALPDPCAHPERQLAGVWDEGVKGRIRAAFLGTGRPYAEETLARVIALLDRHAAAQLSMSREVCEASRGDRPRLEILGLRDACLDRRRGQLQALTALFADRPDPEVLDRAVQASAGIFPVAYCADTDALTARVRPPEDPALRARVAALEPRVDQLEVLHRAGKYRDGLALGEPILVETAELPYAPLRAQVAYWVGKLRDGAGDYEGAKALLRDAAIAAAEGRDDVLAAGAWAALLFTVGERQRRFDEASVIRSLGPTAVARVQDPRAEASWMNAEGAVLHRMGRHAEARASHERALGLREKTLGEGHPDVASSLHNLGTVLCAMDDCQGARVALERAVLVSERSLGPDHPDTASSLSNLGNALRRLGAYEQALITHERALAIKERARGLEHPSVASSLNNLGNVLLDLGDHGRARAVLERALAIKERALGPEHPDVASTRVGFGRVLVRLGRFDEARPLLEGALAAMERGRGTTPSDLADPLLALGELHLARKKPEEAVPALERALAVGSVERAVEIDLGLAEALWELGKDRARAVALAGKARAAYERIHHRPGLERATRWLAEHPLGS
jgi:serine/threonine-protein kinase